MRLLISVLAAFFSLLATASASSLSTDIFYWPVGAASPSVLARVTYDPVSLQSDLVSYTPPSDKHRDELVRVGLYTSTPANPKQWVGSLVSGSSFAEHQPALRLHLGPNSEVYHVAVAAAKASATAPQVVLVSNAAGTQPHLNRPVVVGPDYGQDTEQVVEKTFFQKYWWVFLIITFLTMSGGGGGEERSS
ncbi:hypothetical protein N7474_010557 [Penicillium riverlandense]|uniref:uncharacterized protein n=1 Tax=Penicillium riverlandense TaxID=1903569 RepID=UPI00254813A2|nr:uncharacterized protein N7474_010557 [Penicillium riverlandense]KAJ5806965.1 hypothetical protein N7474_010557 [Penicillium riverlandense]